MRLRTNIQELDHIAPFLPAQGISCRIMTRIIDDDHEPILFFHHFFARLFKRIQIKPVSIKKMIARHIHIIHLSHERVRSPSDLRNDQGLSWIETLVDNHADRSSSSRRRDHIRIERRTILKHPFFHVILKIRISGKACRVFGQYTVI